MIRYLSVVPAALCLTLALLPQAQDAEDAQEEDCRVTSVEGRQRAVENLLSSAAELRNSGQMTAAARALNRVGRFRIRMSLPKDAATTFQQALQLLEQQPDIKTQVDSLNGLASSYGVNKCELTEPSANQALTLSKQNSYVAGEAEALRILSYCQDLRDHALALKTAEDSLTLSSSINHKRGMGDAYVAMGEYQLAQHNLEECARSLEAALNIFRDLNDIGEQAEVLIYFGYIGYRNGDWQGALDYYTRAESMIDKNAEPYKMGQITIGLGDSFLESGMPEVALLKYQESLDYFQIAEDQRAMSVLKWSIGRANYFDGQYQSALDSLKSARSEAQSSNDVTLTAFCNDYLGRTYYAMNEPAIALDHFQSALEGYSSTKNIREAERVRALIGRVQQQQGSLQKARENYQTALATFRRLADRVNESATLYAIGTLELQENNLDKAAEYLQQSVDITEEMRRVSSRGDLTAAFSDTVYDRYETYIECLMRKHSANPAQQYDVRAFELSESARGRSLADLLRGTQTNLAPGVEPQLAEREKSVRQALRVKENYRINLLGKPYKQEELDALNSELARLGGEFKEVTDAITARNPSYAEINRPKSWDLRRIQEQVIADDETVLLEFSLGPNRSYVWVVTRNNFTSRELAPQAEINKAAQDVYGLLRLRPSEETDGRLSAAVKTLSSMVLAPVAGDLNKRRLIVVADGALNYIPFQILRPQPDKDDLLVAQCEIDGGPSASILGQLRQETSRRKDPSKSLAAFGAPVFASNYAQEINASSNEQMVALQVSENQAVRPALRDIETEEDKLNSATIEPLLFTRIELANLRDVAGPESFVATGFDATREKLAEVDLAQYAILHIATHGILDPKRPEKSGLLFTMVNRDGKPQNGFLGLQDVYSLHAPVDLVVLSACRTGLGKDVRGEGLIGLTRGFMYAGAASVVASLWKVDDEATAELMKRFYANMLSDGMTPAAALRAAQNSIRQQPQWSSPYHWAAFTLQGDHRQSMKPVPQGAATRSYPMAILIGAIGTILAIALWSYYYHRARRDRATK